MTKKNTKTSNDNGVSNDSLLNFLAARHGGLQGAKQAFVQETVVGMVRDGATFGEIMTKAKTGGWVSILATVPVKDVLPEPSRASRLRGPGRSRNEMSRLRAGLLDRMKTGEGVRASQLASQLGEDQGLVARQLKRLVSAGLVEASGSKRDRVYGLVPAPAAESQSEPIQS